MKYFLCTSKALFYYGWIKGISMASKLKIYTIHIECVLLHKDIKSLCDSFIKSNYIREFWKGYVLAVNRI